LRNQEVLKQWRRERSIWFLVEGAYTAPGREEMFGFVWVTWEAENT